MGDVVKSSTAAAIYEAIHDVNRTPRLRIEPGMRALISLYKALGHSLSLDELNAAFGNLNAHFGWFCQRVAERLGGHDLDTFALCDKAEGPNGRIMLTVKPAVVKALATWGGKKP
jgi:hypothetical protein